MSETTTTTDEEARSVTSEVEVSVDPGTAFQAFTDELDLWWVRGPINHWDGGRARELRFEPGVGGRLLEMYDEAGEDALELGVVMEWEPGERLAWRSLVDDVETEVGFEAVAGGRTLVRVVATIPAGGVDRGGTAFTRTVPKWFGRWCDRRATAPREVQDIGRLGLAVYYEKPAAAARWLASVVGLTPPDPLPDEADPLPHGHHGHPWLEVRAGNCSVMVFPLEGKRPEGPRSHVPWIYVDDVEASFTKASAAGAEIVQPLGSPWGLSFYVLADPEGNHWTVLQARPTMR